MSVAGRDLDLDLVISSSLYIRVARSGRQQCVSNMARLWIAALCLVIGIVNSSALEDLSEYCHFGCTPGLLDLGPWPLAEGLSARRSWGPMDTHMAIFIRHEIYRNDIFSISFRYLFDQPFHTGLRDATPDCKTRSLCSSGRVVLAEKYGFSRGKSVDISLVEAPGVQKLLAVVCRDQTLSQCQGFSLDGKSVHP